LLNNNELQIIGIVFIVAPSRGHKWI